MNYQEGSIVETDQGVFSLKNGEWVPYNIPQPPGGKPLSDYSFSERVGNIIGDMPRAAGVGARNVIEGLGETVDFLGSPIRAITTLLGGKDPAGGGTMLADYLNLPTPATPTERVVSQAEKIMAGGGGLLGAANKAQNLSKAGSTVQNIFKAMSTRPDIQLTSMVSSGVSGGIAKEKGAGPWTQLGVSVASGIGGPLAYDKVKNASVSAWNAIKNSAKPQTIENKLNNIINITLKEKGIDPKDVTDFVKTQMREDMQKAMKTGGQLSPAAVNRLIDYRITNTTPTAAGVTLDPGVVTKQKNLQAVGANSKDPRMQQLSQVANQNAKKVSENLNNLGGDTADDAIAVAEKTISALDDTATAAQGKIDQLYNAARATDGRSAQLSPSHFAQHANNLLDEHLLGGKLPADVRNILNKIAKGEMPFTVDVAEQLKTRMAALGRSSSDGQERMALGLVRQALDDTPLLGNQGDEAIQAFNTARAANRNWMTNVVNKTPALKAVIDGVEPDKFVNDFILGSSKKASIDAQKNLRKIVEKFPEAHQAIKEYIVKHLKGKLTGGAVDDDMARLNAASYNKALNAIGDRKLRIWFDGDEIAQLKANGRVASYETAQPVGSAVNNSNSANTATAGVLDFLSSNPVIRKLPFGETIVANPSQAISNNITSGRMMDMSKVIAQPRQPLNLEMFAIPGLLGASSIDKR